MSPARLTLLRQAHALSQRELADAIGTTQVYISLLEGGRKHPSPTMLSKLATYFRVEVNVLFLPPTEPCKRRAS